MALGLLAFLAVALAARLLVSYRELVRLRNQAYGAWEATDALHKQRWTLVRELATLCEGWALKAERLLQMSKAYERAQTIDDKIETSSEMSSSLRDIFLQADSQPGVETQKRFIEIRKAILDLDTQIGHRRNEYNQSVILYNTQCLRFPDMIFANLMDYAHLGLYHAAENEPTPHLKMKVPA